MDEQEELMRLPDEPEEPTEPDDGLMDLPDLPEPAEPEEDGLSLPEPAEAESDNLALPEPMEPESDNLALPEPGPERDPELQELPELALPDEGLGDEDLRGTLTEIASRLAAIEEALRAGTGMDI